MNGGPVNGADIEALWVPKGPKGAKGAKKAAAEASGTGVVLDGNVAHKVQVSSGVVATYEVLRADNAKDALSRALDGAKGAGVVVLGGLLFARGVEVAPAPAAMLPQVFVEAGRRCWPASKLAGVAGLPAEGAGKAVLAGWEAQGASELWGALARHRARLLPLPFALPEGAWLVFGASATWLVLVEGGRPEVCRELKAGPSDLGQVAAQVGAELARLAREGRAVGSVGVLGAALDEATTTALARVGVHAAAPVPPGVSRWEIPWAEQGPAALAAMAAVARPPASAWLRSPEELARMAEAPARRRRAVALGLGVAAALGIALTGLLPLAAARSSLSSARADLALARSNEASVRRWLSLRSEVLKLSGQARTVRAPDAGYVPALLEVLSAAPPGSSMTSVNVVSDQGSVSLTVSANVPGSSFDQVAGWQQRLESEGATVQVTGESATRGQMAVAMDVVVPWPPRRPAPARRPARRGRP